MKKLVILLLFVMNILPAYSGYWQLDLRKMVFTGGLFGDCYGGSAAYSDSIFYYLEKPFYEDSVDHKTWRGAASWQTLDGGKTYNPFYGFITNSKEWECKIIEEANTLISYNKIIRIIDENTMYWIGYTRFQLKTTDAGETWKVIELFDSFDYAPQRVSLLDFTMQSNGFGAIMYSQKETSGHSIYKAFMDSILVTTDDWASWQYVRVNKTTYRLTPVSLSTPDTTTIYANMKYYNPDHDKSWTMLCKSTDKGVSWENYEVGKNRFYSMHFVNRDTGWAGGYGYDALSDPKFTVICKTTDGGKTWVRQMTDQLKTNGIQKIQFCNAQEGFALGYSVLDTNIIKRDSTDLVVYHTQDGGAHWYRERPDSMGYTIGFAYDIAIGSPKNSYLIAGWFLFQYVPDGDLGIEDEKLPPMPEEIKVSPNPIPLGKTAILDIGKMYGETISGIYMYNSSGNQVGESIQYTQNSETQLLITLPTELSRGTYMIVIQLGKNRVKYCKVVVG